jgi:hypothetical protein
MFHLVCLVLQLNLRWHQHNGPVVTGWPTSVLAIVTATPFKVSFPVTLCPVDVATVVGPSFGKDCS